MTNPYFQQATFLQSATRGQTLPQANGLEIAFAGRSNAGKSSVINRLCSQNSLARTSKTPGRTQLINFFGLPDGNRLVDLPGYGYAKVPDSVRLEWQSFIENYLTQRQTLMGMILVMDIRHPLTAHDQTLLHWTQSRILPVHILLNKADKLSRGAVAKAVLEVRRAVSVWPKVSVQAFSALDKQGLDACWLHLENWLGQNIVRD